MRIFISVELPDEIRKNISLLVNELKDAGSGAGGERSRAVRWVEEKNLHITLKFLGEVKDNKVENVIELATKAAAGIGSFTANFEGIGAFPSGKSPRVIWAGISEGGEKLKRIADSLEEHFSKAGYRSEEREFSSHVTIGRVKGKKAPRQDFDELSRVARGEGVDKLKEKIAGFKDPKFGEMWINSICIMKSTLTPKGPVYEKVKEVKL